MGKIVQKLVTGLVEGAGAKLRGKAAKVEEMAKVSLSHDENLIGKASSQAQSGPKLSASERNLGLSPTEVAEIRRRLQKGILDVIKDEHQPYIKINSIRLTGYEPEYGHGISFSAKGIADTLIFKGKGGLEQEAVTLTGKAYNQGSLVEYATLYDAQGAEVVRFQRGHRW